MDKQEKGEPLKFLKTVEHYVEDYKIDKQERELNKQNAVHYLAKAKGMELQNYQVYKAFVNLQFWSLVFGVMIGALVMLCFLLFTLTLYT